MIYVYPEKNLRAYPGVERGSKEWDETYKIRATVEKSITLRIVSALLNEKQQMKHIAFRFIASRYITVIDCSCY